MSGNAFHNHTATKRAYNWCAMNSKSDTVRVVACTSSCSIKKGMRRLRSPWLNRLIHRRCRELSGTASLEMLKRKLTTLESSIKDKDLCELSATICFHQAHLATIPLGNAPFRLASGMNCTCLLWGQWSLWPVGRLALLTWPVDRLVISMIRAFHQWNLIKCDEINLEIMCFMFELFEITK